MREFLYPEESTWPELIKRPSQNIMQLEQEVKPILKDVKERGDEALKYYSKQFDQVEAKSLIVSVYEINQAQKKVNPALKQAIRLASQNIEKFHRAQKETVTRIETQPGILCWQKSVPIERIGLYIPGGTAPLFSTVLMLGIPAKIAGCSEIVLCTPPDRKGEVDGSILYAAHSVGIQRIYKVGGAQAIAAMAYGTESIPAVYKIFGPGNQYVTMAKLLISLECVAIDMPAGPSEVAIIADHSAEPDVIAADLLSQAEHGSDSQVLLVSTHAPLLAQVKESILFQLVELPRKKIAEAALRNSILVLLDNVSLALKFVNMYAPEHLIIMTEGPQKIADKVQNAGSVFLGKYAPESVGDYASGTNHTLPTNAMARSFSGISLDSFMKKITFQDISPEGLKNIASAIVTMAEAEQLQAHKRAVEMRLEKLNDRLDNEYR